MDGRGAALYEHFDIPMLCEGWDAIWIEDNGYSYPSIDDTLRRLITIEHDNYPPPDLLGSQGRVVLTGALQPFVDNAVEGIVVTHVLLEHGGGQAGFGAKHVTGLTLHHGFGTVIPVHNGGRVVEDHTLRQRQSGGGWDAPSCIP